MFGSDAFVSDAFGSDALCSDTFGSDAFDGGTVGIGGMATAVVSGLGSSGQGTESSSALTGVINSLGSIL